MIPTIIEVKTDICIDKDTKKILFNKDKAEKNFNIVKNIIYEMAEPKASYLELKNIYTIIADLSNDSFNNLKNIEEIESFRELKFSKPS